MCMAFYSFRIEFAIFLVHFVSKYASEISILYSRQFCIIKNPAITLLTLFQNIHKYVEHLDALGLH